MLSLQLAKIEVLNERKHSAFFSTPNQIRRKLLLFGRCDKTHDPNPRIIETTHEALQSNW